MSKKWITVAPIFNMLAHPPSYPFILDDGETITNLPPVLKDLQPANILEARFKEIADGAEHFLIFEYEADALDHNQIKAEYKLTLVYLSFWLVKNTDFKFSGYAHINHSSGTYTIRHVNLTDICYVGLTANGAAHNSADFAECIKCYITLQKIQLSTPLAIVLKSLTKGITERAWEWRYLCFWVALEALFGADREIIFRLSQRLGLFVGASQSDSEDIFKFAKKAYEIRSKVVHGFELKKLGPKDSLDMMEGIESLLRRSVNKIIRDPKLIEIFQGKNREQFLDQLAFQTKPNE